jgi:hypothetical protein
MERGASGTASVDTLSMQVIKKPVSNLAITDRLIKWS